MKTRLKNKDEKKHDAKMVNDAVDEFVKVAAEFADEFAECDGDVFYSSYQKFSAAKWRYAHDLEASKMTRVGESWDYENGVTGNYKYHDLKK